MSWGTLLTEGIQNFYLFYFLGLNGGYLALNVIAFVSLLSYMDSLILEGLPIDYGKFEPPISVLIPAYNEESTIVDSVRSVLQLSYHEYEVIVINDGAKDRTLEVLQAAFNLQLFPEPSQAHLPTQQVRGVYRSPDYPKLKVIDKHNGGKADSLNAGVNYAIYPLLCCLDADSILQRSSLQEIVQPFLNNDKLVACGGTIRIANGSRIQDGYLEEVDLPRSPLALFQIVEYLRAFLFGRQGWEPLNALLIISGAFGLFRKQAMVAAGGYRTSTIGEDMELIVRMHRQFRLKGEEYRISFISNPVCWTEAPEDLKTLKNQRVRWQRGLLESLWLNRELFLHRKGGAVSWLAFPFFLFFEALGHLIEVSGYFFMVIGFCFGLISFQAMGVFLAVSIGLGTFLSVCSLLLEELSFHLYPRFRHLLVLMGVALIENLGYRQLNTLWRVQGIWQWLTGAQAKWGDMKRKGL
jgi:cellulose synthase/poly-beta-1,6-N-acetylglucosamine synthase-like glycosyltransferase